MAGASELANNGQRLTAAFFSAIHQHPDVDDDHEMMGQTVELKFRALKEGRNEFQLMCLSDCWIGCDRSITVQMKVEKLTKERNPRAKANRAAHESDGESKQGWWFFWRGDDCCHSHHHCLKSSAALHVLQ